MKKKVSFLIVIIVLLLIVALLAAPRKARAGDGQPPISAYGVPHALVFEIDSGHTCVTDYRDGNAYTQCFCPCGEEFELIEEELEIIVEYIDPVPTPDKPRCNRGLGNGAERCDPGNSGGKPGKAGENDG